MTTETQTHNTQKYQYLRPSTYDIAMYPILKGCCITIATIIDKTDGIYTCDWRLTFKNPRDRFSKKIARQAIEELDIDESFGGSIVLGKHYTRFSIVAKILSVLYYHENLLTDNYRVYVRSLLDDVRFSK